MPEDDHNRREDIAASGDEQTVNRESARRTRRSFVIGGAAAAAGYGLWQLVEAGPVIGRQPRALRRIFQADASINRAVFDERGLAPEFPLSKARELRLNGTIGMNQTLDLASWRLQIVGSSVGNGSPLYVPDVTAWKYRYLGEMQPDRQAFDVKSAPGNTLGNPKQKDDEDVPKDNNNPRDEDDQKKAAGGVSKTGTRAQASAQAPSRAKAGGAPNEQKSSPGGKAGQASSAQEKQEPGAGAGSGQPATDAAAAKADPAIAQGSDRDSIADRFDRMREQITHKRYQGTAEAGASASSLDIGTPGLLLTLSDLLQLPRAEHVFEFHCIEGWSEVVQWAGVRLRDLLDAFPPAKVNGREPRYVYMETPDGDYYGGYDLSAARHAQSLLVTEMGGKPLTQEHGAPLRLFMPVKYGYKNLKRIGLIAYTDTRPDDYWTKLGYDWYAGL